MASDTGRTSAPLAAYGVFAAVLAGAGLPIYIHAPKFYVDEYGVSLAALGGVLFVLRLVDVVQDPVLGWLSGRLGAGRGRGVTLAGLVMAGAMIALFALPPAIAPLWWFALVLALVFSGFSFLSIAFYGAGVARVARTPGLGHIRLATWRETGALLGVCLAAMAPTVLGLVTPGPFAFYALCFAAATLAALWLMRGEWGAGGAAAGIDLLDLLRDTTARRLLLIALVNAAPVAVTSTLFLFFVEYRLAAPGAEGPLLVLFFFAAALAAPVWGRAARAFGARIWT